ncbi:hypothetical protein NLC26_02640 [Candidatus Aminicenantes bacterium AC-708-M15]|nr:hypothetical protein [Candidatus Aminicenantes bacterium AC-708-M15]
MQKIMLIILLVITLLNVTLSILPSILNACSCESANGGKCTGNCCYLIGGNCYCYDYGADECEKIGGPEE